MEIELTTSENIDAVSDILTETGGKILDQARTASINKVMAQGMTEIKRSVKADTGVPAKVMGKRMKLWRAKKSKPVARIFIGTMPVKVADLKPRVLKRGVSYPGGTSGRQKDTSAFQQKMPSGHVGIFSRQGRKTWRSPGVRGKITELTVDVARSARRAARRVTRTLIPQKHKQLFAHELTFRTQKEFDRRANP